MYDKDMQFRFRLELAVLIVLKITLLLLIKQLWFSDPIAPHMQVPARLVDQHFLGSSKLPATQSTGVPNERP